MIGVLSPYHLTTREHAGIAALLLAERCVTLLPSPEAATRASVEQAAERSPAYLEFMDSWAWSMPLWHAGLIDSHHAGDDPADDLRTELDRIASDPRCEPLRPLMNVRLLARDEEYLSAIASDVLRSGTDPGVVVPVALGLDRFASARGLVVFRATPESIVQKTEQRLSTRLAAATLPLLAQAPAQRLLEARDSLAQELADLRAAIHAGDQPGFQLAAAGYTRAFELERESLLRCDDPDDPPVMEVLASVAITEMPRDASLRASAAAARRYFAAGAAAAGPTTALADLADTATVRSVVVKPIGRPAPLR